MEWVHELEKISGINIFTYDDFIKAMESRVKFFHQEGCRLSDHGIDKMFLKKQIMKK